MVQDTAVVTGASRGIGGAIVRELRRRGLEVHALARSETELEALAGETGADPHPLDISDVATLCDLIDRIRPDVLVNHAGVLPELAGFPALAPETIDRSVDVNLRAALHATRAALASMLERNRGHVFFVGSIAGRLPSPQTAVYSATKAALHMFADSLRLDLLGSGIRVTTVMPVSAPRRLVSAWYAPRAIPAAYVTSSESPVSRSVTGSASPTTARRWHPGRPSRPPGGRDG